MVVLLVRDLIFRTKIKSTAESLGLSVQAAGSPVRLAEAGGSLLIVDLAEPGAIEAAAAWQSVAPGRRVVGFASHTDAETIRAAREAGLGRILPRSRFVEELPELLQSG